MKKLLEGIVDFRRRILPHCRDKFAELAKGQSPDALFITCSDSRVAPNWFASTDPGDLFVVRNVGNMIPPAGVKPLSTEIDESAIAAAEFAVLRLNVSHIIVCGHSECGAMDAISSHTTIESAIHLKSWLKYGLPAFAKLNKGITLDPELSQSNQLSQLNVLEQVEHLKSHPFIRKQVDDGKLEVHGWWFDIAKADVYRYDKEKRRFQVIE